MGRAVAATCVPRIRVRCEVSSPSRTHARTSTNPRESERARAQVVGECTPAWAGLRGRVDSDPANTAHVRGLLTDMSERRQPPGAREASLSEALQCGVCYSLVCEPITLSCGHTFCRVCTIQVAS